MADLQQFQAQRPQLFSIAYRMLGSATEAEDVLQDAWMRVNAAGVDDVRSPRAFAATIVTRLCLDRLKSARVKREEYIGPWIPEPVLTPEEGPDVLAQRSESVTLAFLILLDALAPEERAVFLLKEVFEYDHGEIADMLGTSAANSRQLLHRAKEKLAAARKGSRSHKTAESFGARRAVAARFAEAFRAGDASRLAALIADDVTFTADGGGKAFAARRPLAGRGDVVKFVVGIQRTAETIGAAADISGQLVQVNNEPALVLRLAGKIDAVWVLTVEDGSVTAIRVVRNPEKLAYLDRQLSTIM